MTLKSFLNLSLLALVGLSSCIKGEKPNIEVDILSVTSPTDGILSVVMQADRVEVYAAPETDLADMRLDVTVSDGATIAPLPEAVTDYSEPVTFRVTSEDGAWTKDYLLAVRHGSVPTRFDFEHWTQPDRMRYLIPYEAIEGADENDESARMMIWACGNQAYNFLTGKQDDYTAFPTQPTATAASGKRAAKLVTRLTGQIDKPIAAGNLFIGQFDCSLYEPRESTQFGLPFTRKPLRFRGMYHYRSGGLTRTSGVEDCCRMQAVLYRTDATVTHLNGFTIKTSPNVVARAELRERVTATPGDGFVPFDLEFVYTSEPDPALLERGGYNLAIIFSSSLNGDVYDGAEGSTLLVDDVEIICSEP